MESCGLEGKGVLEVEDMVDGREGVGAIRIVCVCWVWEAGGEDLVGFGLGVCLLERTKELERSLGLFRVRVWNVLLLMNAPFLHRIFSLSYS